ncbi:MAG: prepilin-type N-terminal cleavage/methylation domain-containing protein [Planctomycetota bacterium JB042]
MRRPKTHRARGMTLIELVVVVGLIGVLFGIVFFRLDFMLPGQRLKSSARQVASHLEQAFNYAVVSGKPVRFEYDLENRAYRFIHPFELEEDGITVKGKGETELLGWTQLPDLILVADVTIGDSTPITGGLVFSMFDPRGVATGHTVHLVREESDTFYSILVSPILGQVDIEPGYHQAEVLDDSQLN